MSLSRTKDIPTEAWGTEIVLDKITLERDKEGINTARGGECLISRDLFFQISDYTQSQPTGPSPGRMYRKALFWPALRPREYPEYIGRDPNWFLFLCVRTPDSRYAESVDHVPFHVTFLED